MTSDLPPKQLSMVITAEQARRMPEPGLPPGYELRAYRPGDEDSWVDAINTGEFYGVWDRAHFEEYIRGPERMEGSRLVVRDRQVVAATFASIEEDAPELGRLDFVVSRPEYRGLGLGRVVCTEVVRGLIEKGYDSVVLYTDDWRKPAIGLYLSMGFEPRMDREDMPERWERIRAKLAWSRLRPDGSRFAIPEVS